MSTHSKEVTRRLHAIKECAAWIEESSGIQVYDKANICFGISPGIGYEIPKEEGEKGGGFIGVFSKRDIACEDEKVLISIPTSVILNCTDSVLRKDKIPRIRSILNDTMNTYESYIEETFENNILKDFDYYKHQYGRIFDVSEVRLTLFLSLLLSFLECRKDEDNSLVKMDTKLKAELERTVHKWMPYLNTLPRDYNSLPPFWSTADQKNIEGTCFSRYITRIQNEYIEIWKQFVEPCLFKAGLHGESNSDIKAIKERKIEKNRMNCLPPFFIMALGITQSRTYGNDVYSRDCEDVEPDLLGRIDGLSMNPLLHPLLDLINGEKSEEYINCEIEYNSQRQCMELKATCDIKAGEEIIISYSDIDAVNFSYLQRFGFLPMKNGLPDPQFTCLFQPMPTSLVPDDSDDLRWNRLVEYGFNKKNIASQIHGTAPFNIIYDHEAIRKYRKTKMYTPHSCPPQIELLCTAAYSLLANDTDLKGIPQEPYLKKYDRGKMMVHIIDLWLEKLQTPSNEYDWKLLSNLRGNLLMGTYMRMLERETLIKWRHAICIRHYCYDYDSELPGPNVKHVPPLGSQSCLMCKATFHVKQCSRCKKVYYCGVKCQKEHWRRGHKEVCNNVATPLNGK